MKEKFIEVHDNILPPFLVNEIYYTTINDLRYQYSSNISGSTSTDNFYPGFNSLLCNSHTQYTDYNFFSFYIQILYQFCFTQSIVIEHIHRVRAFITLPNLGKDLSKGIHTDLSYPNTKKTFPHWTCLYYVNDSDGDTIFYDKNNKEIKRISPKKGRIVFFDGSIPHSGNYSTKNERIGVNINFKGKLWN